MDKIYGVYEDGVLQYVSISLPSAMYMAESLSTLSGKYVVEERAVVPVEDYTYLSTRFNEMCKKLNEILNKSELLGVVRVGDYLEGAVEDLFNAYVELLEE